MKNLTVTLFFLLIIANLSAEIAVKSFRKLESDMTARIEAPKKDQNGDVCAIIKVVTTQTGFIWEPDGLGIISSEWKNGEYWLYVPYGAKRMTVKHDKLGILRDYLYPMPIEKACVYEMELITGKVITTVDETIPTKFLIITSSPSGADVYINDQHKGQTPFQKEMPEGEYTYRISKDLYHPTAGKVNLTSNKDKEQLDFQLQPNFGFAQISSKPEDGMTVTLNGKVLSQTTPLKTDTLRSGKYTVSVSKTFFHPQSKEIMIADNQTVPIEFELLPAFGSMYIETKPENGASISLDGKPMGLTTPQKIDRLASGERTITLRKEWFEPQTIKVKIEDGVSLKQSIELKPNFGTVKLSTDTESELFVDNESKGNGKWEGRLIAGLHTFEAKKAKHHTALQKVVIEVDDSKQINLSPQPIVGKLKIVTNAIGASVKLNDKEYGSTPCVVSDLFIGDYKLTIEKEGFKKFYKNIVIEEGKTTEVNETLSNGITVNFQSTPLGATLFVDNKEVGRTPTTITLPIGNHKVKLVNGKKIVEETIAVSEGTTTDFTFDVNDFVAVFFKGNLGENRLEVDGKSKGEIPLSTKLNIGVHSVKVVKGNEVIEKQITVESDKKNEFYFKTRDFIQSFYKKHVLSVSYAYHQSSFTNATFTNRIANGSLTKEYGHAAAISYNLFPIEITGTVFNAGFKAHNLAPFNDNASIKHQGIELSAIYMPINIGTSIFPYVGAGYQLSRLYSAPGTMTIDGEAITNTSMPAVKGGLKVKFGHLFLFGEYKQTFSVSGSDYNSKQLSAGLGWIF